MRIYLAGPMRNIAQFNFPAFHSAAGQLRSGGHEVFSPAEHQEFAGFDYTGHAAGDLAAAEAAGFSLREALGADLAWICAEADAVVLLPGWENSLGARAEAATGHALGLLVTGLGEFLGNYARRMHKLRTSDEMRARPG